MSRAADLEYDIRALWIAIIFIFAMGMAIILTGGYYDGEHERRLNALEIKCGEVKQ